MRPIPIIYPLEGIVSAKCEQPLAQTHPSGPKDLPCLRRATHMVERKRMCRQHAGQFALTWFDERAEEAKR